MRLGRLVTYSLVIFSALLSSLQAKEELLRADDVKQVMRRIFEYHVDQKKITQEILKRSLKVYIDQFDPERIYLLKSEVDQYLNPSSALLNEMEKQYQKSELTVYLQLEALLRQGVSRSRALREEIEKNPAPLFNDLKDPTVRPLYPRPEFADSLNQLKERISDRLQRFMVAQRKKAGEEQIKGHETAAIDLYERNVRGAEDKYLNLDDNRKEISGPEKEHNLTLRAVKALAKSLDAHTSFFSAQEAYDMRVRLEKGFHGIGIVLQEGIEGVTVVRLVDGGPASRSGLIKAKDRLIEVDGVPLKGHSFDSVLDLIRGEEGSTVTLGLIRDEENGRQFNVQLQRERVVMNDTRVDMSMEQVEGGIIGKLTLHSFYDGENGISSERDLRNAIRELYQKGNVKGLVLDLRDNTGGFLMQAVKVAGLFISNGVVVISKYSDGEVRYFRDIDGHAYYNGPLIILASQASASAAEIVAQTLQDYGVALIVGDEHTYGKGSIQHQTVTGKESDSFFKVTVGRYYTVSGRSTQIRGVQADIVVPTEFSAESIGEKYLDFPLSYEEVAPAYIDSLSDIDPAAKRWYLKYYLPTIQPRKEDYQAILPVLKERSGKRRVGNVKYDTYLKVARGEDASSPEEQKIFDQIIADPTKVDPPMEEAVNIMKDMIQLLPKSGSMNQIFPKEQKE